MTTITFYTLAELAELYAAQWGPYTNPVTKKAGWKSANGAVRYTAPPQAKGGGAVPSPSQEATASVASTRASIKAGDLAKSCTLAGKVAGGNAVSRDDAEALKALIPKLSVPQIKALNAQVQAGKASGKLKADHVAAFVAKIQACQAEHTLGSITADLKARPDPAPPAAPAKVNKTLAGITKDLQARPPAPVPAAVPAPAAPAGRSLLDRVGSAFAAPFRAAADNIRTMAELPAAARKARADYLAEQAAAGREQATRTVTQFRQSVAAGTLTPAQADRELAGLDALDRDGLADFAHVVGVRTWGVDRDEVIATIKDRVRDAGAELYAAAGMADPSTPENAATIEAICAISPADIRAAMPPTPATTQHPAPRPRQTPA